MRVYSHFYWIVIFLQPIPDDGWRRRGGKFSKTLGKNTIFNNIEHPVCMWTYYTPCTQYTMYTATPTAYLFSFFWMRERLLNRPLPNLPSSLCPVTCNTDPHMQHYYLPCYHWKLECHQILFQKEHPRIWQMTSEFRVLLQLHTHINALVIFGMSCVCKH